MKKYSLKGQIRHYGLLLLGVGILAFGLYNVHSQSGITEGGVLGMTLLLQHWFGISPGISGLCMDTLCYIVGYRLLGTSFLKNAIVASVGFSAFYNVFELFDYTLPNLSGVPLAASIMGGLFVGVGVGIVVREGGAAGGDDALALMISKITRTRIAKAYFFTDFVVLMLSLSYIPLERIAYSLITVTISSYTIDKLQKRQPKAQTA